MNRRARKFRDVRRAFSGALEPGPLVQEILAKYAGFRFEQARRIVVFEPTGKKFWLHDSASLRSFVLGSAYSRTMGTRATLPAAGPRTGSVADVPLATIVVPEMVADRMVVIATALFNQLVISSVCRYPFECQAAAPETYILCCC